MRCDPQVIGPQSPLPLGWAGDEEEEVDGDKHGLDPDQLQTLPGGARR